MKTIKNLLLLAICIIAVSRHTLAKAQAQSQRIATPMGGVISISPGTIITQASPATTFYTETIPANTFVANRWYHLRMAFKLTTPTISIPGLSVTFQLGSQTFNLMSNAALVGGSTNGLFLIEFTMVSTGTATQIPFAVVQQPNGSLITLNSSQSPVGAFTVDMTQDQILNVTLQFTGVSLGTSSLNNFWCFRDPF